MEIAKNFYVLSNKTEAELSKYSYLCYRSDDGTFSHGACHGSLPTIL